MKSLPGVRALGGLVIIVVTKEHEIGAKAIDKRSRTSVQCIANLMVKFTRVHQLIKVGACV